MITLRHLLCTEIVSRDAETNKVSLFNIYEGVEAEGYPLLLPNFSIIVFFVRDQTDPNRPETLLTLSFEGEELLRSPINVDFQDRRLTRSIVKFQGLAIERAGTLAVSVLLHEQVLGGTSIEFSQRNPSRATITSTSG